MARIMGIDYGQKRVGLAVTDPDQIIATGLTTVKEPEVIDFIFEYLSREEVERFVVGEAKNLDNTPAQSAPMIKGFVKKLKKRFVEIPVDMVDERFTSKLAVQSMVLSGVKKKNRQKKELVDEISATIILQSWLEMNSK